MTNERSEHRKRFNAELAAIIKKIERVEKKNETTAAGHDCNYFAIYIFFVPRVCYVVVRKVRGRSVKLSTAVGPNSTTDKLLSIVVLCVGH